jgi:hypothetical protein
MRNPFTLPPVQAWLTRKEGHNHRRSRLDTGPVLRKTYLRSGETGRSGECRTVAAPPVVTNELPLRDSPCMSVDVIRDLV